MQYIELHRHSVSEIQFTKRGRKRFEIDSRTGCWIWLLACRNGRPAYTYWTSGNVVRWVYEKLFGLIESGMECHHTCENILCVNPLHIEVLTSEEHNARHKIRGPMAISDVERKRRSEHGRNMIHYAYDAQARLGRETIARMKGDAARAKLKLTVRDGSLWCAGCKQWKPDESFGVDQRQTQRRGRNYRCLSCAARIASRNYARRQARSKEVV
jgi:hypothetical protein